jgi:DNA repair protein RadC
MNLTLYCKHGNRYRPADMTAVYAAVREVAQQDFNATRPLLASPTASRDFLRQRMIGLEHEVFLVVFLDSRHRVIECREMFRGTVDGASVHPREVVKEALRLNACAVIVAHNHPSGIADPSQADEVITTHLRDALGLVEIRLLDHLIVGGDKVTSLAEKGLI